MTNRANWKLWKYETISSTMDAAKSHLQELKDNEKAVVVTDIQTAGRGRFGKNWESPEGGLYATFILKDENTVVPKQALSLVIGLSIVDALGLSPKEIGLKWPNDIVARADKRKLCGILVESTVSENRIVYYLGIGLNLKKISMPNAVSLDELSTIGLSKSELINKFVDTVERDFELFRQIGFEPFAKKWAEWCVLNNNEITVKNGEEFTGICREISIDGALCIEVSSEIKKIYSGTVVRW